MPAGYLGTKRMGELAELAFMYRAASEGIWVARPYGDSHPYDFLVQHGRKLLRVQVKSCFTPHRTGFPIHVCRKVAKDKGLQYSEEDVDFIAAYIAPHQAWYLIPIESLKKMKCIRLYPGGINLRSTPFYETYREAWHLLKQQENTENAETKQRRKLTKGKPAVQLPEVAHSSPPLA
jgi:hypothetical protein